MRGYTQVLVWHPDFGFTDVHEPWPHRFAVYVKTKDLQHYVDKCRECLAAAQRENDVVSPTWANCYVADLTVKYKQLTPGTWEFPCGCVSAPMTVGFRPGDLAWPEMPLDVTRNRLGRR